MAASRVRFRARLLLALTGWRKYWLYAEFEDMNEPVGVR